MYSIFFLLHRNIGHWIFNELESFQLSIVLSFHRLRLHNYAEDVKIVLCFLGEQKRFPRLWSGSSVVVSCRDQVVFGMSLQKNVLNDVFRNAGRRDRHPFACCSSSTGHQSWPPKRMPRCWCRTSAPTSVDRSSPGPGTPSGCAAASPRRCQTGIEVDPELRPVCWTRPGGRWPGSRRQRTERRTCWWGLWGIGASTKKLMDKLVSC